MFVIRMFGMLIGNGSYIVLLLNLSASAVKIRNCGFTMVNAQFSYVIQSISSC